MNRRQRKSALWREVVWYGWVTGALLILVNASVASLLGVGGIPELFGV